MPMIESDRLRLFLAIPISEEVRMEFRRVQQELKPLLPPPRVRWARDDQFHLTLKFLGNVPAAATGALSEAVRDVCAGAMPMRLCAGGTGFFPNERSPRVLWAGITSQDDLLLEFQSRLEGAVGRFAEKQEVKPFTAHVTLARFERLGRRDVEEIIRHTQNRRNFGEWTAGRVELIQSTLSPSGAVHAIFAAFTTKIV